MKTGFKPRDMKLLCGAPVTSAKQAIVEFTEEVEADGLVCGCRGIVYSKLCTLI